MLAAYRRDDWTVTDAEALSVHLTGCAECRQREAVYRQTGERIRQLPAIVPPPEFRARVFAAIRAEELRVAPEVARLARAATDPALPAIRAARPISLRARQPRVAFNVRTAMAIAAVLALTLVTARVLPLLGASPFSKGAASLNGAVLTSTTSGSHLTQYALPGGYTFASSALATASWLVYNASDASRSNTLFAENRRTKRTLALLAAPTPRSLTVRALTSGWAIWSAGTGTASDSWLLQAGRLPQDGTSAAAPLTLLDSSASGANAPRTLGGVWASGNIVLVSVATLSGAEVLRFDLSSATPQMSVIASSTSPGHLLTDPSSDNGTYYWADVWFDGASGLHSVVWQRDSAGHINQMTGDNGAFHPRATHGTLVWVEVAPDALAHMSPISGVGAADDDELLLGELDGSLQARNLGNGQQWQVSDRADVTSVETGNSLLLWQSDAQTHIYDLHARSASALDGQVRGATFAAANGSTVVWRSAASSDLNVYDAS